jgi:outer membrane protein insertion porin family
MAIGVTSPLIFTKMSYAQAVDQVDQIVQSNQVLYYGWQQNDGSEASELETAVEIANSAPVDAVHAEVIFASSDNLTNVAANGSDQHSSSTVLLDFDVNEPLVNEPVDFSFVDHQPTSTIAQDLSPDEATDAEVTEPLEIEESEESEVEPEVEPELEPEVQVEESADELRLDGTAPADTGQTIADIEVRFLNKEGEIEEGHTRPSVYLREFNLEPGTPYDEVEAQQGLDRISRLPIVRFADVVLEPTDDPEQVTMVVLVRERRSPILVDLAPVSPSPSGLEGPFQQNSVLGRGQAQATGLSAVGAVRFLNLGGNDQTLTVQLEGGETVFNTELSFRDPWIGNDPTGIAFNVFNQRSVQRVFAEGDRDIDLPNRNTPWVHRLGGGVEVFRPVAEDWDFALGVNYQQVSIHNSAFESERFERDQLGERLIVSDDDFDDLLTVQFSGEFNQIEYLEDAIVPAPLFDLPPEPIEGPRFRFGIDQAIPVGDASIAFTRLSANYLYYLPLDLFGFTEGPRTLVLNAQTGFMFGDIPPYEAFDLDAGPLGSYQGSGLASGSRFALVAAEYRFPIVNFRLIRRDVELGGALFSGFASTLGSADEVIGDPSVNRQKPEDGLIGGVGLRARTAFGLFRLEVSVNGDGNAQLVFSGGGKF